MTRSRAVVQMPEGSQSSGVDVLDRAFAVLAAFGPQDGGLSLAELSTRTGLYKSTLLRLAGSLIHHRFLVRLEDGRYRLGSGCLALGGRYQESLGLGDVLLPVMRALNQELGEAIAFHIPDGDQRICLYRINATFSIGHQIREGAVQTLELGAGGRVLLAFAGREGAPYDEIRRRYSYMSLGERDPEVAGLSAPVFGARQSLVGALGIVGPITRLDRSFMIRERGRLLAAAAAATADLGGDPLPLRRAALEP